MHTPGPRYPLLSSQPPRHDSEILFREISPLMSLCPLNGSHALVKPYGTNSGSLGTVEIPKDSDMNHSYRLTGGDSYATLAITTKWKGGPSV